MLHQSITILLPIGKIHIFLNECHYICSKTNRVLNMDDLLWLYILPDGHFLGVVSTSSLYWLQNFRRCYVCFSPHTEELLFVHAPALPKPYSMNVFRPYVDDQRDALSKPIRLPKFDKGPHPCPRSVTPWSYAPTPPGAPRPRAPIRPCTPIEALASQRPASIVPR